MKAGKSISTQTSQSIKLVLVIISLYCLWCTSQIYWRNPPQPAVGEEADLGVLVFLSIYFFLPHSLCIMSMNPKEYLNTTGPLPLWWFHSNQLYNYLFSSCCRRKLCWVRPGLLTIVKLPLYGFKLLYLTDQRNRTYIQYCANVVCLNYAFKTFRWDWIQYQRGSASIVLLTWMPCLLFQCVVDLLQLLEADGASKFTLVINGESLTSYFY